MSHNNYQMFLSDILTSVLGQKYQNFELIIVDHYNKNISINRTQVYL
jgi:hypothetical protein